MTAERGLLLDTHVWLWLVEGVRREISAACESLIESHRGKGTLLVSAVSVREVALLVARGRLRLSMPGHAWTRQAMGPQGIRPLPLDAASAALSAALPAGIHRDPADQMLVASALVHGLTLVTRDRALLDYGRAGHVAAMDAAARTA